MGTSLARDMDGNVSNYDIGEDPKIETLGEKSIGFHTSNGRV